ncbi:hypothetical protein B0H16DRAFT_1470473 [Mycena metata]|uniref:Uncharacterized protein n=1 Tax=Mycena metata TaxID=1033252 RepID=A0AAD7HUL1_9AGAR|nr:hypothetical protein B0H16DRAFT_1470473 [Mycena metata]
MVEKDLIASHVFMIAKPFMIIREGILSNRRRFYPGNARRRRPPVPVPFMHFARGMTGRDGTPLTGPVRPVKTVTASIPNSQAYNKHSRHLNSVPKYQLSDKWLTCLAWRVFIVCARISKPTGRISFSSWRIRTLDDAVELFRAARGKASCPFKPFNALDVRTYAPIFRTKVSLSETDHEKLEPTSFLARDRVLNSESTSRCPIIRLSGHYEGLPRRICKIDAVPDPDSSVFPTGTYRAPARVAGDQQAESRVVVITNNILPQEAPVAEKS